MKLKILLFALLFGLVAVPAKAVLCLYETGEYYDGFYEVLQSKRGDEIEFVKFCYQEALDMGRTVDDDYNDFGIHIPNAAAKYNRVEAIKFFVGEKGLSFEKTLGISQPMTALQYASQNGNYTITKYLLDKGANPVKKAVTTKKDSYAYAKDSGVTSVINIVKTAWDKWQRTSDLRQKEYKNEIKSINMNDYEKFKLDHKLSKFSADKFFA